jgi:hypothetical protein
VLLFKSSTGGNKMKQHKWHKEIKAWADGAEIDCKLCDISDSFWVTTPNPTWSNTHDYRIKPQPKKPQYLYVYMNRAISTNNYVFRMSENEDGLYMGKIKLEDDDA